MSAKDENITMGLDRLNAMFAWWGVPGANGSTANGMGQIDGQMKRFQSFTSDLQKAYTDAYSNQMGTLLGANERIARSFQEILGCRQPQDVIAAESKVFATILEEASLQAKTWIELTQKVQDYCAAMARDTATNVRTQPTDGAEAKPAGRPAPSPVRDAGRHQAHS